MGYNKRISKALRKMGSGGKVTPPYASYQNYNPNTADMMPSSYSSNTMFGQGSSGGGVGINTQQQTQEQTQDGSFDLNSLGSSLSGLDSTGMMQLIPVANMGGSMAFDAVSGISGISAGPNKKGFIDPGAAFGQAQMSNIGYGPLSYLAGYSAMKDAKENNQDLKRQYNIQGGWDRLAKTGMLPQQSSYTQLMPYGGMVGSQLVELEKGESFMTPDGNIESIPDSAPTHKGGGVKIPIQEGSMVLGKKMSKKDKKTFKKMGVDLKRAQDKYEKALRERPTSLASNTAKRNLENIKKEFVGKFKEQGENVSAPKMPYGGPVDPTRYQEKDEMGNIIPIMNKSEKGNTIFNPGEWNNNWWDLGNYGIFDSKDERGIMGGNRPPYYNSPEIGSQINNSPQQQIQTEQLSTTTPTYGVPFYISDWYNKMSTINSVGTPTGGGYINDYSKVDNHLTTPIDVEDFQKFAGITVDGKIGPQTTAAWLENGNSYLNKNSKLIGGFQNAMKKGTSSIPNTKISSNSIWSKMGNSIQTSRTNYNPKDVNYSDTINTIGSLAPIVYNLYKGLQPPDRVKESDFANPYEQAARAKMARRRYNVQPELERSALSAATARRMSQEGNFTPGMLAGINQGTLVNQRRADAETFARAQMINNQFLSEQAGMEYGIGKDISARRAAVYDINQRQQAVNEQYTAAALSQLGQYAQTKQMMDNQKLRDQQLAGLWPSLAPGYYYNPDTYGVEYTPTPKKYSKRESSKIINGK